MELDSMEDKDIKDFNRGLSFFNEKDYLFVLFSKSEPIKDLLFNEFLMTDEHPDLYLFQASIFKNEFEHHRFLRSNEVGVLDGNTDNPFKQMLDAIFNTWVEHQQNKTLDRKFYAHFIEDCPTWKIIKDIIGAYNRAIENLIRAEYKEELRTADSFIKTIDRNLSNINTDLAKRDILNIFYQKENTMCDYSLLTKFCKSDDEQEEAHRRFDTFSQEIDNYIYDKITEFHEQEQNNIKTTKADIKPNDPYGDKVKEFKDRLNELGFFSLPMIKTLNIKQHNELIIPIIEKGRPYGVAMFDYLEFFDYLDVTLSNEKINYKIEKLFYPEAKDTRATQIRGLRNSLTKVTQKRYDALKYKEEVRIKYENIR